MLTPSQPSARGPLTWLGRESSSSQIQRPKMPILGTAWPELRANRPALKGLDFNYGTSVSVAVLMRAGWALFGSLPRWRHRHSGVLVVTARGAVATERI